MSINGTVNGNALSANGNAHSENGNEASVLHLFMHWKDKLVGSLCGQGFNGANVEEAVQLAFIKYIQNNMEQHFQNGKQAYAWLRIVARNLLISGLRKGSNNYTASEEVTDGRHENLPPQKPAEYRLIATEESEEKQNMQALLPELIALLSDDEQAVISGVYLDNIKQRAMAGIIGKHEGTLSRMRVKALERLREAFEARGHDGSCLYSN